METKVTTIRIETKIKKLLKIKATERDITQTQLINEYIINGLRNDGVEI